MTAFAAPAIGLAVGAVLGLLGAGGSLLTVPALVVLLGLSAVEATGTSLLVVALMAVAGLITHRRAGRCSCRHGAIFAASGVLTSVAAGWSAGAIPDQVLAVAFVVVLLGTAAWFALRARRGEDETVANPATSSDGHPHAADIAMGRVVVSGAGVGVVTGILGVGGGFLVVPALVATLGLPVAIAIGTSQLVILVNALAGLGGRALGAAELAWGLGALFAVGGVVGATLGSRFTERFDATGLHYAFAVVAALAGVVMLLRTFG